MMPYYDRAIKADRLCDGPDVDLLEFGGQVEMLFLQHSHWRTQPACDVVVHLGYLPFPGPIRVVEGVKAAWPKMLRLDIRRDAIQRAEEVTADVPRGSSKDA